MILRVKTYCLTLFILLTFPLLAQDTSKVNCVSCSSELIRSSIQKQFQTLTNASFEYSGLGGFVIPHHEDMDHLYSHSLGCQFAALKSIPNAINSGKHQIGILVNYLNTGSTILGNGASVAVLFRQGLTQKKEARSEFFVHLALGMGYLTQKYDQLLNPENRAIGTNLNGFMQLGFDYHCQISTSDYFVLGKLAFSHFSNASWQYPNLGINIPSLQVGIGKNLNLRIRKKNIPQNIDVQSKLKKWSHSVSIRFAKKEIDVDDQRDFLIGLLDYTAGIKRNSNSNYRLSFDVFHDPSYNFEKFKPLISSTISNSTELAISGGYQTDFGKWGLIFDFGYYLYKPKKSYKTPYYEGIGCSYKINEKFKLMARLKANKTTADFAELGLVYSFN